LAKTTFRQGLEALRLSNRECALPTREVHA